MIVPTSPAVERALDLRAAHPDVPARTRLAWAHAPAPSAWMAALADGDSVRLKGFTLRATVEMDEDPDTSYLGRFTDSWEPGAVANPEAHYSWRTLRWFVPEITYDEHRHGLSSLGFSRGVSDALARRYVRQDMDAAREPEHYVVTVTASAGAELGRAAVHGVDRPDPSYLHAILDDLVDEAVDAADAVRHEICTSA